MSAIAGESVPGISDRVAAEIDVALRCISPERRFGSLRELKGVSFDFRRGEIFRLVSPNCSGKITTVNVATDFYPLNGGSVLRFGRDTTGVAPHRITV